MARPSALFNMSCLGKALPTTIASSSRIPSSQILPLFRFGGAIQIRSSTKRGGGSTKNNRNSSGKRLGVKRSGGQFVKPGEIILRQRGTSWHPGENAKMGSDHTIYALEPGYVCFYRPNPIPEVALPQQGEREVLSSSSSSPSKPSLRISSLPLQSAFPKTETIKAHPSASLLKRKTGKRYIGISLEKDAVLPRPFGMPRERRFGSQDIVAATRHREAQDRVETVEMQEETRDDGSSAIHSQNVV